jgi:hypothetical protein
VALLSGLSAISVWSTIGAATLLFGCSFVLDTDSLQKGGAAGAGGTTHIGSGGAAGAHVMDAAADAPTCPTSPDHDPCGDCVAMHCCAETLRCTTDGACNLAYVEFQRCQRAAKKAPNPNIASGACTNAFVNGGGMPAAGLVGCTLTNCSTVCG